MGRRDAIIERFGTRMLPVTRARKSALVEALDVYCISTLAEEVGVLSGQLPANPIEGAPELPRHAG
jgi:hypothetical protein